MRKRREVIRRPTRPSARTSGPVDYTVEILGRRYAAIDMVDASRKVEAIIAESGMGYSEIGAEFPIRADGIVVAYVSYNGRVWMGPPGSFDEKSIPVYDPSAHQGEATPTRITPSRVVRNNPGEAVYEVVDEEGNVIRRFQLRSDARRFAREHNEDRHPDTMEYFVKTAEMRGCHHLRTSDYARQGEVFLRCGICERPRR